MDKTNNFKFINEYSKIIKIPDGKKYSKKDRKICSCFLEKTKRTYKRRSISFEYLYRRRYYFVFYKSKHLSLNYSLENEDSESSSLLDILNDNSIDPPDKNLNGESLKEIYQSASWI